MNTKMPMVTRADATFIPKTYDDESHTVEMVWTTGARVRRRDWLDGDYDEELEVTEEAVDLTRLASGRAPLLSSHESNSLHSIIGVVESAWILGPNGRKEGRAKVRFSSRADVEPIVQDVRDGIIRNVSVGYAVNKWEKRQAKGDDVPVMRAVRWQPMELSLVCLPADAQSHVRTGRGKMFTTVIEDIAMDVAVDPAVLAAADPDLAIRAGGKSDPDPKPDAHVPEPKPAPDPEADIPKDSEGRPSPPPMPPIAPDRVPPPATPVETERARCAGINLTARKLLLDQRHADKLIEDGIALDVARERLIGLWADKHKDSEVNTPVHLVRDEGETKVRTLTDALLFRVSAKPLTDAVRENGFQYLRLTDIARECLEANGVRTRGMAPMQIAQLAMQPGYTRMSGGLHTTSDFANVLQATIGTTLRQAYDQAPATYTFWARRATAPDYRSMSRVQLSSVSRLQSVGEHGEYKRGTLQDSKEAYAVAKYGEIIGITREVIVNDYLDVFGRIPAALAAAARSLESDIVYRQLLANANMADGVALFNATHGNDDTPAVISVTSLGTGMTLMALQMNNNGAPMNLTPRYLLVPPGIRPVAEQLINGALYPALPGSVVPSYMRGLEVITEARLHTGISIDGTTVAGDTNGWFLIADPSQIDTIEYAYLEGSEGVYTETRNGFDIDGVEVKVRLDFGAKAIDYRGMVRNAGA